MRRVLSTFLTLLLLIANLNFVFSGELPPHISVEIPMRDGTFLPADVYLPNLDEKGLPCILIRCPNGRKGYALEYAPYAQEGYAVVIQDTRSCLSSDIPSPPYLADGWGDLQDGYDTVEWLSKSEYTNGRIGTCGVSALGITQLLMAPTAPPGLTCQHIGVAAASLYHHAIFNGGQFHKSQVEGWLSLYSNDVGALALAFNQPQYNTFWQNFDTIQQASNVNVPAIHFGGWFDVFSEGTIDGFLSRHHEGAEGAKGKQKLVIGPWTHYWPRQEKLGDFDIPEGGNQVPIDFSAKRWFDFHLKEMDNGANEIPTVTYYVMGPFDGTASKGNRWKTSDVWPVPSKSTPFYFAENGKLLRQLKPRKVKSEKFTYNPENPTPTIGGRNLFLEAGPKDQRPIEERDDVLVFTTDQLSEDLEVTGKIIAKVFFSSDQSDSDVVVRLTDVYPDGRSILIADGIRRLGNIEGVTPGPGAFNQPIEVDVDLWTTSVVFAKGHRIRVSVTSSNYPRFEKNPNTCSPEMHMGCPLIAENKVYMGGNRLSRLILPVVSNNE